MSETKIKICGITSPEDAEACVEMGADFLGLIFAESARKVSAALAGEIRLAVPDATLVGVFANMSLDGVAMVAATIGLDMIQLHGNETPVFVEAASASTGLPLLRAIQPGNDFSLEDLKRYSSVDYFLYDLEKGKSCTDNALPRLWSEAERAIEFGYRLFLAGKLSADNVRDAVVQTKPFGVDVCSGVEAQPGKKDLNKVQRFITEVKSCP